MHRTRRSFRFLATRYVLAPVAFLALAGAAPVPSPRLAVPANDVIVSPAWLAQHLHDRDVVVLQLVDEPGTQVSHITGAQLMMSNALEAQGEMKPGSAMTMDLPGVDAIHATLEKLGVSDGSHVVVAYRGGAVSATRAIFLMTYAGLTHVSLLDGGIGAWHRGGFPMSDAAVAPAAPGRLAAAAHPVAAVDYAYVQSHIKRPGFAIVDARASGYYSGAADARMGMLAGHIPGAGNVPYNSLVDDDGALLAPSAIEAKFRTAGVRAGDTVVVYCHVGLQATMVALSGRLVGLPVRVYAGSFHDWSARKLPTEGGSE